jgi:SAM-dependent methyltransferase
MDFGDPKAQQVFFDVYAGMPRAGPGSRACTARALSIAGALPRAPRLLDIACGPGMQTLDLAELLPDAGIVALDNHQPFLVEVARRAASRGAGGRVTTVRADMASIPFPSHSFDLVWCEGAAYIMGLESALRAWRPLLAPEGKLALTEAVWLRPDPPEPVRRCFASGYPGMADVPSCRKLVGDCGYALLDDFVLPEGAWRENYYEPMCARLAQLAPIYAGDLVGEAVLADFRAEIEMYERFAAYYGYVFLVMSARGV